MLWQRWTDTLAVLKAGRNIINCTSSQVCKKVGSDMLKVDLPDSIKIIIAQKLLHAVQACTNFV
jgi:hypothetical protein